MKGAELVVVIVAAAVIGYALDLRRRPHTRCWVCKGSGRVAGSTDKRFGFCRWCRNKPPRLRAGAGLVNPKLRRKR